MEQRKVLMMEWDGLEDDDDEFLESRDRISTVNFDIASSGSDDDDKDNEDDTRVSFTSTLSGPPEELRGFSAVAMAASNSMLEDYNIWMAEPGSIKERRKRLLQGMGLSRDKELLKLASAEFKRAASKKEGSCPFMVVSTSACAKELKQESSPSTMVIRSRSDGSIAGNLQYNKHRRVQFISTSSRKRLMRSFSAPSALGDHRLLLGTNLIKPYSKEIGIGCGDGTNSPTLFSSMNSSEGAFFLIKNLDTGKEFIVNEFNEDGMWNRLKDLQTGEHLTMEEFEKCVGYSPIVKELMCRENVAEIPDDSIVGNERKSILSASLSKNFRSSKRRGVGWLKNIKGVANSINGFIGDKERDHLSLMEQRPSKNSSSGWTKVRQHGKSYKELTGLYMCQEIQAHQGSIWSIRFSPDARYLASAGEDRIIHVWEVVDCGVMSSRALDEVNSTPLHPMASNSPGRPPLSEAQSLPSERKRRGRVSSSSRKGRSISDYVVMPDTVFSLSDKPVCSFQGHLDDVLDLSWSKSQKLLSSSMDKTVRLWDMESKSCLKLFAHNDYVTCIQFNPADDRYFISGSLDAKVRIWSIPDRQVVDWIDLHQMVTAACYTPDGKGALIGSHKGCCRLYNISDFKLHQKGRIDVINKKKSQAKKITGFQFAPGNPSEVLITSADSRIRIFDGSDVIHKFRGFRNTSSQISASFTADGKYVVCASEDSQVRIWKRDEIRNVGGGKGKGLLTTRSHEHFQCRDVSVAIPWPGSIKYETPLWSFQSKRHSKNPNSLSSPSTGAPTFEDAFMSSSNRRNSAPLPKKTSFSKEHAKASQSDSGIGGSNSFASNSASFNYGDSPSISSSCNSSSSSSSLRWFDGSNSSRGHSVHATAWGMVIVTAGLGGEIRAYQNFGMPLRLSRQANLFRDYKVPKQLETQLT